MYVVQSYGEALVNVFAGIVVKMCVDEIIICECNLMLLTGEILFIKLSISTYQRPVRVSVYIRKKIVNGTSIAESVGLLQNISLLFAYRYSRRIDHVQVTNSGFER